MSRSLVLNATFEPLSVVAPRRALVLVLVGKADVLHEHASRCRSEYLDCSMPSVVKLRYHVRAPFGRRVALSRRGVFVRDGGQCQYCDSPADSIDHVVPRSRGGPHTWENVVAACRRCNALKRDRLLDQTPLRLRRAPTAPPVGSWVSASVATLPLEWRPYVGAEQLSA
jgi:5-methylcytosine-specific restriction endonuclease McrA